jgi:hypothetical protein
MASTPPTTNLRARIEVTTRAFLSAFEEGSTQQDASIINRDVTPDCTRHMLPSSILSAFSLPSDFAFDTTTFQQTFAKDIKVLKFKNNILSNLVIDTEARRAAFTSVAEVHVNGGDVYSAEQAWVLYFTEDGTKVEKVIEFCDKDVILKMANESA